MAGDNSPDTVPSAGIAAAGVAVRLFGAPEPVTVADLETALAYLQLTPVARDADRAAFTDEAWRNPEALGALIRAGERLAKRRGDAAKVFVDGVLDESGLIADYAAIRADIATKSSHPFRFLDGGYRRGLALLRAGLRGPLPKAPAERLKIVELALRLKQAEAEFAGLEGAGAAFGALWRGAGSDWRALDNVLRWRRSHDRLPASVWPRLAAASESDLASADGARRSLHAVLTGLISPLKT